MSFTVFKRPWWRENPEWPNGLEPEPNGRRTIIRSHVETEEEARQIAQDYNRSNDPGRYSTKAEFTEN